jgi:hypothetical protein
MNSQQPNARNSLKNPKPVFGVACVTLSGVAIIAPFVISPYLGVEVDMYLRAPVPVIATAMAVLALIRRERAIWPIIGLILTAFYVGLHFIATA